LGVFFFRAEDGIRDFHVTGVQTCALPICDLMAAYADQGPEGVAQAIAEFKEKIEPFKDAAGAFKDLAEEFKNLDEIIGTFGQLRSEQRRVGRDCGRIDARMP